MTDLTYVPLTLDSSLVEMQVALERTHAVPEFHETPDRKRWPVTAMLHSGDRWFCILRAFPVLGARVAVGRGRTRIDALIDVVNKRARHHFDLRTCAHETAKSNCWPEVVEGHCRHCGRIESGDLTSSAPRAAEVAGACRVEEIRTADRRCRNPEPNTSEGHRRELLDIVDGLRDAETPETYQPIEHELLWTMREKVAQAVDLNVLREEILRDIDRALVRMIKDARLLDQRWAEVVRMAEANAGLGLATVEAMRERAEAVKDAPTVETIQAYEAARAFAVSELSLKESELPLLAEVARAAGWIK